jgi:hypothetical protein
MQQKELATLLDISPAMVSRLVKRGMPTDTIERAERWRRRHLEPGRVKGSRADTIKPALAPPKTNRPQAAPPVLVSVPDMEAVGGLIEDALAKGNQYGAAVRAFQLRCLMRQITDNDCPVRLTLRVWVFLLDYVLHQEAEVRSAIATGELLTAAEFCSSSTQSQNHWSPGSVLFEVCDFDDDALNGWPDSYFEDDEIEN